MSFILDALKKSESDHQRQGGPALFEVKVAPPRGVLPPWAIAIAVLLLANLGVVLWLLLRHGAGAGAGAADVPPVATASATATPHGVPAAAAATAPAIAAAASAAPPTEPTPPPPSAGVAVRAAAAPTPALTANDAGPPKSVAPEPAANPDDYAPAAEPPAAGTSRVVRGTDAGVPLYQEIATAPGNTVPQLRLDLLAYADKPDDRWVMVNMHKLKEGDSLPEGVGVESITPDGAVLSWHGQRFLLTRE
jgi:general secretion pathway protein B